MTASPPKLGGAVTRPRLLDEVRARIRAIHYRRRTEESYTDWIKRFIFFHKKRHPRDMGAPEVEAFLSALATERNVSVSTQNQALAAELPWPQNMLRARTRVRLPVVLTRKEVNNLLVPAHWYPRPHGVLTVENGK